MMEQVSWNKLSEEKRTRCIARPARREDPKLLETVRGIVTAVKTRGKAALNHYADWIDGASPERIAVAPYARRALATLEPDLIAAIHLAAQNIETFHRATKPADMKVETMAGLTVATTWRPLAHAGIYVPGGSAPLFSSLLMLAIPARVAGVKKLTIVTPPRPEGLHPAIALAADICGIEEIWTVGGAQAIAALAFGADEMEPADIICGPGNAWVAAAKNLVASMPGGPRIDLPAGPSELMIIADDSADPALIAADLLSQAEHDALAQVILVTSSREIAERTLPELQRQLAGLPRAEVALASLFSGRTIIVNDLADAIAIANRYAPEHLSLALRDPESLIPGIANAGAIFAGAGAAETFGDYLAGSSHVLPTDGAAARWSGVSAATFMKAITVQSVTGPVRGEIATAAALLARAEGLEAHARAAEARLLEAVK